MEYFEWLGIEVLHIASHKEVIIDDRRLRSIHDILHVNEVLRSHICEPWVIKNLSSSSVGANSLLRIFGQQLVDEVGEVGGVRDLRCVWYLLLLVLDHRIHALCALAMERQGSGEHLVHNNAYSPPIGGEGVTVASQELRCEVSGCSRHFERDLVLEEDPGHAKINDLQVALLIQKQVLQLKVSMHDVLVVEILDAKDELDDEELDLLLVELAGLLEHRGELTAGHERHDEVESFLRLEEHLQLDHKLVVDSFEDLELRERCTDGVLLDEPVFPDALDGVHLFSPRQLTAVHFPKGAHSKDVRDEKVIQFYCCVLTFIWEDELRLILVVEFCVNLLVKVDAVLFCQRSMLPRRAGTRSLLLLFSSYRAEFVACPSGNQRSTIWHYYTAA